jgi:hypothetical protein
MDERNEENVSDLFARFLEGEAAEKAAEDIRKGEEILREHPAPEPDGELIADIKARIRRELFVEKTRLTKRVVLRAAAVAAAFLIVAAVSVKLFERGGEEQRKVVKVATLPSEIWEDDGDLATLSAEVEEAEDEAAGLRLGGNGGNGEASLVELEIELVEIVSDFWKG